MRVVGRDVELAAVERALDEVGLGFAAIVVCGDPGIGKTTVWRHGVAAAQARGFQVIRCCPAEPETWLSFSGLADLMAEVPGHALDALPGPQRDALDVALLKRAAPRRGADHRAISTAVTGVVRHLAAAVPVVVAVDDLHWLDAATAEVLAYLLRRLVSEPVLLLATVRDSPGLLPAGLDQILSGDRVRRVRLGSLAARELYELVRDRTGLTMAWPELLRLHEASCGSPLLAVEIARALSQSHARLAPGEPLPIPESIAALVTERVSALPAATLTALLAASAMAHPTVGQIRAALSANGEVFPGSAEGLLDSAEDCGVLCLRDGVVRFAHPLFSSAIYAAAPSARRRRMHRHLAALVNDDGERAWHMALAVPGPDREVAAAVEKAARAAHARGATSAAAELWELASRRTPGSDPGDAAERTVAAALCLLLVGDAGRARSMLEEVTAGMTAGPQLARALLVLATVVYYQCPLPSRGNRMLARASASGQGARGRGSRRLPADRAQTPVQPRLLHSGAARRLSRPDGHRPRGRPTRDRDRRPPRRPIRRGAAPGRAWLHRPVTRRPRRRRRCRRAGAPPGTSRRHALRARPHPVDRGPDPATAQGKAAGARSVPAGSADLRHLAEPAVVRTGYGGNPPAGPAQRLSPRPHAHRAARRAPGRRRPDQQADRRHPAHQRQNRRGQPHPGIPQAAHPLPARTCRRRPPRAELRLALPYLGDHAAIPGRGKEVRLT